MVISASIDTKLASKRHDEKVRSYFSQGFLIETPFKTPKIKPPITRPPLLSNTNNKQLIINPRNMDTIDFPLRNSRVVYHHPSVDPGYLAVTF